MRSRCEVTGAELVALDALTLLVVIDNESDILSSVDPGVPKLSEVSQLLERAPIALSHATHHGHLVFDQLCWGCHGLSVLITASRGHETRTALFDVGPDGDRWLSKPSGSGWTSPAVEVVFLSHRHFDHSGGLPTVLAAIAQARAAAGLAPPVLDIHPERPHQRGITLPTGTIRLFPPEPTLAELTAGGAAMFTSADPHALLGGLLYGSGMIARETSYETGLHGHMDRRDRRGQRGSADPRRAIRRRARPRPRVHRAVSVFSRRHRQSRTVSARRVSR